MEGYSVKVVNSSMELTVKQKIALKDLSGCISLDEVTEVGARFVVTPTGWVELAVHNEKSKEQKDYTKFVIIADDGHMYMTGSQAFVTAFRDIWADMKNEAPDEVFSVECYKLESKNYKGKHFLTCSIVL